MLTENEIKIANACIISASLQGSKQLLFLFCMVHYILLILNKYEKAIISQLRIDKLERISHLSRQDKQVATSTAMSVFGRAVFLGRHCWFILRSLLSHFSFPIVGLKFTFQTAACLKELAFLT